MIGKPPLKILIVDDIFVSAHFLSLFLSKHHFEVLVAKSPTQGLRLVEEKKPDLILSDITMPEMDGHEALTKIRAKDNHKNIPAFAVTVAGTSVDTSNFDGLIKKPIRQKNLFDTIYSQFYPQEQEKNTINVVTHFKITKEQNQLIKKQFSQAKRTKSIDDIISLSNTILSLNINNNLLNNYIKELKERSEQFEVDEVHNMIEKLEFEIFF